VTPQSGNWVSTSLGLGNSGLCWTVFALNRDTAVSAEVNGDWPTLICVLVARPRRCLVLSNPVPWQNCMVTYLGYTLQMKTLFRGWLVMADETHTRRMRRAQHMLTYSRQFHHASLQHDFASKGEYNVLHGVSKKWYLLFSEPLTTVVKHPWKFLALILLFYYHLWSKLTTCSCHLRHCYIICTLLSWAAQSLSP